MFRAPSQANLPHLHTLLNDIHGDIDQIARHLGISASTLRKYRALGQAPRIRDACPFLGVHLGPHDSRRSGIQSRSGTRSTGRKPKRQNKRLMEQIQQLEDELSETESHAANAPIFRVG